MQFTRTGAEAIRIVSIIILALSSESRTASAEETDPSVAPDERETLPTMEFSVEETPAAAEPPPTSTEMTPEPQGGKAPAKHRRVPQAAKPLSESTPIMVNSRELETIDFSKIVVPKGLRLLRGMELVPETYRAQFLNELKTAGYNVVDGDEPLFPARDEQAARLTLGGTIKRLTCTRKSERRAICNIAVRWQLFDNQLKMLVYEFKSKSRREIVTHPLVIRNETQKLVTDNITPLLSRYAFVEAVKKEFFKSREPLDYPYATIKMCQAIAHRLPRSMPIVQEASAMVKSSGVLASGYFISEDGLLLTSDSVLVHGGPIMVQIAGGETVSADVIRRDYVHGLALLKLNIGKTECLTPNFNPVEPGMDVYSTGASKELDGAFSELGATVAKMDHLDGRSFVMIHGEIERAMAGAPVMNDRGQVVGIFSHSVRIEGIYGTGVIIPIQSVFASLSITPGAETSLAVDDNAALTADHFPTGPVIESDDPPFESLTIEPSEITIKGDYSFKERWLASPGRYIFMIGSLATVVAGSVLGIISYAQFSGAGTKNDDVLGEYSELSQDEFDSLLTQNVIGWSIAGIGATLAVVFFATPKDKTLLEIEELSKKSGLDFGLDISFNERGFAVEGRF